MQEMNRVCAIGISERGATTSLISRTARAAATTMNTEMGTKLTGLSKCQSISLLLLSESFNPSASSFDREAIN